MEEFLHFLRCARVQCRDESLDHVVTRLIEPRIKDTDAQFQVTARHFRFGWRYEDEREVRHDPLPYPPKILCGAQPLGSVTDRSQKVTNLYHLIFREIAGARGTERDRIAINGHRPISTMRFVNFTESSEQRTHVVPLNVVIQRVTKNLQQRHAVVVIQLYGHR